MFSISMSLLCINKKLTSASTSKTVSFTVTLYPKMTLPPLSTGGSQVTFRAKEVSTSTLTLVGALGAGESYTMRDRTSVLEKWSKF